MYHTLTYYYTILLYDYTTRLLYTTILRAILPNYYYYYYTMLLNDYTTIPLHATIVLHYSTILLYYYTTILTYYSTMQSYVVSPPPPQLCLAHTHAQTQVTAPRSRLSSPDRPAIPTHSWNLPEGKGSRSHGYGKQSSWRAGRMSYCVQKNGETTTRRHPTRQPGAHCASTGRKKQPEI